MATLTSFAQMAEDVVLWRALRHRQPGSYVDVGAHHPVGSSVTKIFYNAGWRGVNIEPIESLLGLFNDDRPDEVNLAVGISDKAGELEFFDVVDDQQRSTFDPALADMYRQEGRRVERRPIPVVTLDSVFEQHVTGDVHFLKIDAEGHEAEVLRSLDLTKYRPHIVVAEGALHRADEWPALLVAAGYRAALFDGVNRFFVAGEQWEELGDALSYPACPLDDFVTFDRLLEVNTLRDERDRLHGELAAMRVEVAELRSEMAAYRAPRRGWRRRSAGTA